MSVYKLIFSCKCEISGFFGCLEPNSFFIQRGNGGLTYDESKSHFTAWALMKSPLLVRNLSCHSPSDPYLSFRLERM